MLTSWTSFVLASVKFSIASDVEIRDPSLAHFLSLVRDHLAIVNDLASYDKEIRDFRSGASQDIINIVDVIHRLLSLPDEDSAKGMAYAYQVQTEEWMKEELERLRIGDYLSENQWHFIDAVITCAAGNAFYSMISSRYGGEAARISGRSSGINGGIDKKDGPIVEGKALRQYPKAPWISRMVAQLDPMRLLRSGLLCLKRLFVQ